MATTRATIRSDLRNDLRIDPNGKVWSDSVLNQLIHEGELEVARRNLTITELETTDTFNATIGVRNYDLLTNLNSVFSRIISVIYDAEQQTAYTAATIAFNDANPDTITDTANGLGNFVAGMKLQVLNSTSNDGVDELEIAAGGVAAGTLTLTAASSVTVEAAGATISLIGATDPDHTLSLKRVEDIRELEKNAFSNVASYPSKYAVFNNDLYFDVLPKEADLIQVRYVKLPDLMAADATNSDVPDELLPLVRLWAQYLAWGQVPDEGNNRNSALQRFERELRRQITMRSLNDYQLRKYQTANWRVRNLR